MRECDVCVCMYLWVFVCRLFLRVCLCEAVEITLFHKPFKDLWWGERLWASTSSHCKSYLSAERFVIDGRSSLHVRARVRVRVRMCVRVDRKPYSKSDKTSRFARPCNTSEAVRHNLSSLYFVLKECFSIVDAHLSSSPARTNDNNYDNDTAAQQQQEHLQ